MAVNSGNVRRGISGVLSVGDLDASAPTGTGSALTGYTDLGWLGQWPSRTLPGTGASTPYRGFQNNGVVFVSRTPSDDSPAYSFILLETKLEVVEFALGVTVSQGANDGSYDIDVNAPREHKRVVFDVIDGENLRRDFLPYAMVTEIGDQVFAYNEPIGYEITVEAERDPDLGFNVRVWETALATAG